jgi:Glycosyltransferase sugar-binding region containing DXD motif
VLEIIQSTAATPAAQKDDDGIRAIIIAAARSLDDDNFATAREHLRLFPLTFCHQSRRTIAMALWKRILLSERSGHGESRKDNAPSSPAAQNLKLGSGYAAPQSEDVEIVELLDKFNRAISDKNQIWNAYHSINALESLLGATDTAAIARTTLWEHALTADPIFFEGIFELSYRGGGQFCSTALELFLGTRTDYVPVYWHFIMLAKTTQAETEIKQVVEKNGRTELLPLFEVYSKQMWQHPASEIVAAAQALVSKHHRSKIADYMADMSFRPEDLPIIVSGFPDLVDGSPTGQAALSLMQGRLAVAKGQWQEAIAQLAVAKEDPKFRIAADILTAQALTGLKQADQAITILDDIVSRADVSKFARARATFQRLSTEIAATRRPLPDAKPERSFSESSGRPLAQSLWIGPKLRWIERLAIKSFLDNGWRFQLYVYDDPDNVPEGCEVLDASVIIPERQVFKEGVTSGLHAGSIGAFSDLFRYQLLYQRGGMWTDTDVINFKKFDPDGERFISSEISDASLVTPNGAIMAAPAGDSFVGRAHERALELLSTRGEIFFTRVGPYLLAELLLERGLDAIELMPPAFLGPISWMNSASLLQPFDLMMAREEIRSATNLHVYTETWRTLMLGLDRPPSSDTFLGQLYSRSFGED